MKARIGGTGGAERNSFDMIRMRVGKKKQKQKKTIEIKEAKGG